MNLSTRQLHDRNHGLTDFDYATPTRLLDAFFGIRHRYIFTSGSNILNRLHKIITFRNRNVTTLHSTPVQSRRTTPSTESTLLRPHDETRIGKSRETIRFS